MDSLITIILNLFLMVLMGSLCSSHAYTFYVGGKDGWVADPYENYNHWAERNRFQVNDTLIFKYKQGLDSVLEVSKDDYYKCFKSKPIQTLKARESGSEFKFGRSGPFFFISGYADNCERGQKLIIVVIFPRPKGKKTPSPIANSPTPASHPAPSPFPLEASPPPQIGVPKPSPDDHFAPASAKSAASSILGGSIASMLGLVSIVICSIFF